MSKHIDDHNNLSDIELIRLKINIMDSKLIQIRKERIAAKKELKKLIRKGVVQESCQVTSSL
jgi:hypothetical protein